MRRWRQSRIFSVSFDVMRFFVFVVSAAAGALVCRSGLGREERGRRESARACVRERRK